MEKVVGSLIYEVSASIEGGFSSTLKNAGTQLENVGTSARIADAELKKLGDATTQLNKDFLSGKVGLSDYKKGLSDMSNQKEAFTTFGNLSNSQKELVKNFNKGKISLEDFNNQMTSSTQKSGLLADGLETAKVAAIGLGFFALNALKNFFVSSVKASSDLNESVSKTKVIFGEGSDSIIKFADNSAKSLGISKTSALDGASSFALFGKSAGFSAQEISKFSISQVKLASDLASFFNTKPQDALEALRSAYSGQSEPLRRYNININETKLKQELLNLGIKTGSQVLTDNQRILATQSLITKQVSDATGDFERTSDGLANRQRILLARSEDIKALFGGSLLGATKLLNTEYLKLLDSFSKTGESTNTAGKGLYQATAGGLAFVKVVVQMLKMSALFIDTMLNFGSIVGGFVVDSVRYASNAIGLFGVGLGKIISGDFKSGFKEISKGFNSLSNPDLSKTEALWQRTKERFNGLNESVDKTTASIKESIEIAATGNGFNAISNAQVQTAGKGVKTIDELGKTIKETGNTADNSAKKTDSFVGKLIDIKNRASDASVELSGKLNESIKKFGTEIGSSFEDTSKKLAEIIVNAEQKQSDLKTQIGSGTATADQQKELDKLQKTIDARVGYEERANKRIEDIRTKFQNAGIDTSGLNLDALKTEKDFSKQILDQKRIASLDEFTRFEEESSIKLQKLTDQTISELTILKQKYDKQKEYELDVTTFVESSSLKQKTAVENFANTAIQKYGEMANSLRSVIDLQSQIGGVGSGIKKPQFHDGGYVDARGGDVHSGEFVIPANLVRSMPSLISQIESMRTGGSNQVNNININANGNSSVDFNDVAQQLAWKLGNV